MNTYIHQRWNQQKQGGNMNFVCPFCNRDVRVTAPPDKAEDKWEELKTWLKKHPNQIHYMGQATIESVVRKMEELEKS